MSIVECIQCSATTKSGDRCKKRTCKYAFMCWQHTKQILHLGVKTSAIPNAGSGLFTFVDIPSDKIICKYDGTIIDKDDYKDNGYGVGIPRGKVVDGASTQSSIGRYSNCCKPSDKNNKHCKGNNAKFSISTRNDITNINIKSTKRIPAGSEIFVSYGRGFFR